jgi:hypothetical protein
MVLPYTTYALITADSGLSQDSQESKICSFEAIPVPKINLHTRALEQQKLEGLHDKPIQGWYSTKRINWKK